MALPTREALGAEDGSEIPWIFNRDTTHDGLRTPLRYGNFLVSHVQILRERPSNCESLTARWLGSP